jgi:dehydrogenase/reductase SDR family protein 12
MSTSEPSNGENKSGSAGTTLGRLLDRAMDWLVLPGYSKIGYLTRQFLLPSGSSDVSGRSILVTGASAGIGEAACVRFAQLGARIHLVVRNADRGRAAVDRISAASGSRDIRLHLCDVSSMESVRDFSARFVDSGEPLNVLINNAGVLVHERTYTNEGFELTFATNVLGPFLMTALLLPVLRRSAPARVINVSSGGMYTARIDLDDLQLERREFDGAGFYAHTKRAEVILSEEWAKRLPRDEVTVHSTHPGWVETPGVATSLPRFHRIMGPLLRDPAAGADTIVWLAGSPEAARTSGEFWHDRRTRPRHRLPWTRESEAERARLFTACEDLCGLQPGGATDGSSRMTRKEK